MRSLVLSCFIVFMSCSSSREVVSTKQLSALNEAVAAKNFEVNSDWAQPLSINAGVTGLQNLMPPGSNINKISLIGNTNFFRVKKDSVHMELPYFGQQRMPLGYNSAVGLEFNGKTDKFEQAFSEKRNAYILKYWLDGQPEDYTVILTLFANNSSILSIQSSHRSSVNYNGSWGNIKKEQ